MTSTPPPLSRVDPEILNRRRSGQIGNHPNGIGTHHDLAPDPRGGAQGVRRSPNGHTFIGSDGTENASEPPPFPVDVFPADVQTFITAGAAALNVPPDMIAVPLLGFAAGVIGNSRALLVKPGWIERLNLWLATIGDPGSGKSPALTYAQRPIAALQRAAVERWRAEIEAWGNACAAAKQRKEPLPDKPALQHFFTTDATVEALAPMLESSAGATVVRDELVGWVKSHDAYRQAGDRQAYLSLWAGSALKVDRKIAGTVYVEHPCVPVVGGIQPDLLSDLAEEANRRDGFVDRLLLSWPTALPQRWNENEVDEAVISRVVDLFGRLRIERRQGEDPSVVRFDAEARQAFGAWYDENADLTKAATGLAAGFYAKYPGQLARLCLVLRALAAPDDRHGDVNAETVRDGIALIEYFRGHLPRILPRFAAVAPEKSAALATRVLRIHTKAPGQWIPRRDLHAKLGRSVPADDLRAVLDHLAADGRLELRTVETGARPREESRYPGMNNEHMNNSKTRVNPGENELFISSYVHTGGSESGADAGSNGAACISCARPLPPGRRHVCAGCEVSP